MICRYCQMERSIWDFTQYTQRDFDDCKFCHELIYNSGNCTRATENGRIILLGYHIAKNPKTKSDINLYFGYNDNNTLIIENGFGQYNILLSFDKLMPLTKDFIDKVHKNLKLWQVFS